MCFLSFADDVTVTEVNVFVKRGEDEFLWKEGKGSSEPLRDDRGFSSPESSDNAERSV